MGLGGGVRGPWFSSIFIKISWKKSQIFHENRSSKFFFHIHRIFYRSRIFYHWKKLAKFGEKIGKIQYWWIIHEILFFGVYDINWKVLKWGGSSSKMYKNSSRRTSRPTNLLLLFFGGRNPFLPQSMKLKDVWDVILKVLTHVRTHPEELLVPKI